MNITAKDWNISSKAGYPLWHGLLMAVPVVNLITLITFAYSTWPLETKLLESELRDPKA